MRKLKRGCTLFEGTHPGEYFLGSKKRAIRISCHQDKFIAEQLLQDQSADQIISQTPTHFISSVNTLLVELAHQRLLDTRESAITLSKRFISKVEGRAKKNSKPQSDAAFIQLQNRITPELLQTSWIDGVNDGGVEILSARQNFLIEISGNNRVATLLYPLLLASGVSQVRYKRNLRPIGDLDIAVAGIRNSEIGFAFNKECESLRREYSLFPLDSSANYLDELSTPELRVHCGEIDPEELSSWMCASQPFMHIPTPLGDIAEIGPLVIPGRTPCVRCAELAHRDHSGAQSIRHLRRNQSDEYPAIAAHFVAAVAASQIIAYCDGPSNVETIGRVISIDYQSLTKMQVAAITRHPLCGCAFQSAGN